MHPDLEADFRYCTEMLPRVSRTFALNISVLRGELHRSIVVSYLWCRILDTIEDAHEFPTDRKIQALERFEKVFEEDGLVNLGRLEALLAELQDLDGEADEIELVQNAARVARVYNSLSAEHRTAIEPSLFAMSRGMADYQSRGGIPAAAGLDDEADLDRYCYVVAGTVGELLTGLFLQEASVDSYRETVLRSLAVSFGLGLQTTNITKDVMVDLERGWCYFPKSIMSRALEGARDASLPSFDAVRRSLSFMIPKCLSHLRDALAYVTALPRSSRRIRLFCIWPVWLAARTLEMMSDPDFDYRPGVSPKITREDVKSVVLRTSLMFWSDRWLRRDFDRMGTAIERNLAVRSGSA